MAERKRPTERTPRTGVEVPIPKRGEFFGNLEKIAGKAAKGSATRGPKQQ
jgi:hypothetical protein